jgi:antitoxin component of MazEF toxin-antitoxin module
MSAVIYDPLNIKVIATYADKAVARRMLNNAINKGHKLDGRRYIADRLAMFEVTTAEDFRENVDHFVTVKNLMSGKDVTIKASDQGTCVDPSTETYWSM